MKHTVYNFISAKILAWSRTFFLARLVHRPTGRVKLYTLHFNPELSHCVPPIPVHTTSILFESDSVHIYFCQKFALVRDFTFLAVLLPTPTDVLYMTKLYTLHLTPDLSHCLATIPVQPTGVLYGADSVKMYFRQNLPLSGT